MEKNKNTELAYIDKNCKSSKQVTGIQVTAIKLNQRHINALTHTISGIR